MPPYPYRKITKEEVIEDYNNLLSSEFKLFSPVGNKALDFFFQRERSMTQYKTKVSALEAWNNDKTRKSLETTALRLYGDQEYERRMRETLNVIYPTYQFRPILAKYVYNILGANKILDPFSGWGGRLIGATSLGLEYIGIDNNKNLKKPYEGLIKTLDLKNVKMVIADSTKVDFNKYDYDFIFTSPPYFELEAKKPVETYSHMKEYQDYNDFMSNLIIPVFSNSFKSLKKGGKMALNIPKLMYDNGIKQIFGKYNRILKIPIQNRFSGGDVKRFISIYVWIK
jgi:tRNA G10  N-methylase Trm11